jgi:large subunit ribosomal protein L24
MRPRTVQHIKKKDLVQVMVGKEKGKTGKILRVNQKTGRVYIEKLNIVKRHTKATGNTPGGIIDQEGPIYGANVLLYCDKCGRGVRTLPKVQDNGKKTRVCRKCGSQLDK